jgi:hypothetical protein
LQRLLVLLLGVIGELLFNIRVWVFCLLLCLGLLLSLLEEL